MCRLKTGTIFSIVPYRLNNYATFMSQSKMTNTVRKILLNTGPLSEIPSGGKFIDIAQCLSILNRKSYRQGMNYAISNIKFYSNTGTSIQVKILPNHWCMDNSTTKMFELWKEQRALVLKESPSLKAKWSDFKIFMNTDHAAAGVGGNLTPLAPDGTPYLLGSWEASEITTPVDGGATGTSHQSTIHVVGDNVPAGVFQPGVTTSVSAIQQYADSRALIMSPDPVPLGGGVFRETVYNLTSAHDEMAQEIMNDVTFQNDTPPYDRIGYPGGSAQPYLELGDIAILNNYGDAASFSTYNTGPMVPALGLINLGFGIAGDPSQTVSIEIDLVPGKYKGVLAERGL